MVKIEDVVVPSKGTGKYFGVRCLQIDVKKSGNSSPDFYWFLKKATPYAIDEVQTEIPGETILEGNLTMTPEEYALWGTDDSYVFDWSLGKLGFVEIEDTPIE